MDFAGDGMLNNTDVLQLNQEIMYVFLIIKTQYHHNNLQGLMIMKKICLLIFAGDGLPWKMDRSIKLLQLNDKY